MTSPVTQAQMAVPSDYRLSGPLAGFIGAQQEQDWRDSQARDFRSSDLQYETDKNKLEQEKLDNPVLAAKRQLDQSKMGLEQEQYDTGKMKEQVDAEQKAKLSEATARMTTGQVTDVVNRGKAVQSAYANFEKDGDSPMSEVRNKDYYENQFLPLMKQMGGGNKYPPTWGPEARAAVEKANKSAIDTIPHLQKMQEEKQKADDTLKLHAQDTAGKIEAAEIMANGRAGLAEAKLPQEAQILKNIDERGGKYTEADVQALKTVYDTTYGPKAHDALQGRRASDLMAWDLTDKNSAERSKLAKEAGISADVSSNAYADAMFIKKEKDLADKFIAGRLAKYEPANKKAAVAPTKVAPTTLVPSQPKVGDTRIGPNGQLQHAVRKGTAPMVPPVEVPVNQEGVVSP